MVMIVSLLYVEVPRLLMGYHTPAATHNRVPRGLRGLQPLAFVFWASSPAAAGFCRASQVRCKR